MKNLQALIVISYLATLYAHNTSAAPACGAVTNPQPGQHSPSRRDGASSFILKSIACHQTWHGWPEVQKIFSFGDSYTDSGFNPSGPQPDRLHPLGNPFSNSTIAPYHTFTNGPNWIEFLTTKYNMSYVETHNLAKSGSCVNNTVLGVDSTADLVHQVGDRFVPNYVKENTVGWNSSNSLFTLFFGVNDVNRSWNKRDPKINDAIFSSYLNLLDQLYRYGARNFLLHDVPPIDRGPYVPKSDAAIEAPDINDFNYRMTVLFDDFTKHHPNVSATLFSTNDLFSKVIDNPGAFPQTAIYKNTTGSCKAYEQGDVPRMDYFNTTCQYPVNQYFWLNGLHPTYPIHEALAAQVADALA